MKVVDIKEAMELASKGAIFIDTRSPAEYEKDHIPGAQNIPLLTNEERREIGILYKTMGQEKAIEKGYEIVNPKINSMLDEYNKHKPKQLIIYCWRGGLRSKSVVNLLLSKGYRAVQLKGGYKSYREYVRKRLNKLNLKGRLVVIHGLTGSGKTEFIRETKLPKIDLEGNAQHRSSVFGRLGLKPHSQKFFESLLVKDLEQAMNEKYIIIEGESRKIGDLFMPPKLWEAMKKGIHVWLDRPVDKRVDIIIKEYGTIENLDKKELSNIIESIRKLMPKKTTEQLLEYIKESKTREFVKLLLEEYYDKRYKCWQGEYDLVIKDLTNSEIEEKLKSFLEEVC